jgi:hypothetical protein
VVLTDGYPSATSEFLEQPFCRLFLSFITMSTLAAGATQRFEATFVAV